MGFLTFFIKRFLLIWCIKANSGNEDIKKIRKTLWRILWLTYSYTLILLYIFLYSYITLSYTRILLYCCVPCTTDTSLTYFLCVPPTQAVLSTTSPLIKSSGEIQFHFVCITALLASVRIVLYSVTRFFAFSPYLQHLYCIWGNIIGFILLNRICSEDSSKKLPHCRQATCMS